MVQARTALWTLVPLFSVAASANGQWVSGQATHYGPFPQFPAWSEPGFQPGAVGVGCASSSNDPRWNAILSGGLLPNPDLPANAATVWPVEYVVAVSEAVYGGAKKDQYCFQKITIRNSNDHSKQITATIVDFCPAGSCLWSANALAHNVDLYGGAAWQALGGATLDGSINIDIIWPGGAQPAALTAASAAPAQQATSHTASPSQGPVVQKAAVRKSSRTTVAHSSSPHQSKHSQSPLAEATATERIQPIDIVTSRSEPIASARPVATVGSAHATQRSRSGRSHSASKAHIEHTVSEATTSSYNADYYSPVQCPGKKDY